MRSWLLARKRLVVVVGAVVAGLLGASVVTVALVAGSGAVGEDVDCSRLEAVSFDEAGPIARGCGREVEVLGERTPWVTVWATPGGENRLEASAVPVRAMVAGEWTDVDPSLVVDEGRGVVGVAAPVFGMEFSAGGEGAVGDPLGGIEREDHRLDVGFPLPLPEPVVSGSRAEYVLGEGIRLVVSVNPDGTGFYPVIELADPAAAEVFAGMLATARAGEVAPGSELDIPFELTVSEGLEVVPLVGGAIEVRDAAGEVVFDAPPPVMWDSSSAGVPSERAADLGVATGAEFDRSVSPAEGDRIEAMGVTVTGTTVVLRPDAKMLADPATEWPVYLDPSFSGHGAASRTAIRTGEYTGSLWNFTDAASNMPGEGAGYCSDTVSCNVRFTQRLIWQFGDMAAISAMGRADIVSAGFTVNGTHSAYCSATRTDLHWTDAINAASTWGSVGWGGIAGSRTEAQRAACAAGTPGYRTFDATEAIRLFAENDLSTITLGLKAADESTMTSWKRFAADATLSVTYNRPPTAPTELKITKPQSTCATGSQRPWINTHFPLLSAYFHDPDGGLVTPEFHVSNGGSWDVFWQRLAPRASGSTAELSVSGQNAPNGLADGWYSFYARVSDGTFTTDSTTRCEFSIDTVRPGPPGISPVREGPDVEAVYEADIERGGVGVKGAFELSPGASTDVVAFRYSFGDPTTMSTVKVSIGSSTVIPYDPPTGGPVLLTVQSVDRAGNLSDVGEYAFDVGSPVEDVVWKLDEVSGAMAADSGPKQAGPLTISGASRVPGPLALFGARDDDLALKFDGVNDAALSGGPVVDTSKSFTVSAHVLLEGAKVGSVDRVALSQDGLTQSGFRLGYQARCGPASTPCWAFSMPDTSGGAVKAAFSAGLVTTDEWVHLVGEHDASAKTLRLWVCPVGTPEQPGIGEPLGVSPVVRGGAAWKTPGVFAVGRGQSAGAGAAWWPGQVDNVRVFSGQVLDEAKLRRLCQGGEAESFGTGSAGFNAVDPTVKG